MRIANFTEFTEFYEENKKNIQVEKFHYEAHRSPQSWCNTSDGEKFNPNTCSIVKISSWGGDRGAGIDGYCKRDENKIECDKDYLLVIQEEEQSTNGGSRDRLDIELFNTNTKEWLFSYCGSVSNWAVCIREDDSIFNLVYDEDEECDCLACRSERAYEEIEDFISLLDSQEKLDTNFTNDLREKMEDKK